MLIQRDRGRERPPPVPALVPARIAARAIRLDRGRVRGRSEGPEGGGERGEARCGVPWEEEEDEEEEDGAECEVGEAAGGGPEGRPARLEGVLDGHGFVEEIAKGGCVGLYRQH